jgi:hypothetical protein
MRRRARSDRERTGALRKSWKVAAIVNETADRLATVLARSDPGAARPGVAARDARRKLEPADIDYPTLGSR